MSNRILTIEKEENKWYVMDGNEIITATLTKKQAERFVKLNIAENTMGYEEVIAGCFDRMYEMYIACNGCPDSDLVSLYEERLMEEFHQVCKLSVSFSKWTVQLAGRKWYGKLSIVEHHSDSLAGRITAHPTLYSFS